jgi:hypothetical protein
VIGSGRTQACEFKSGRLDETKSIAALLRLDVGLMGIGM